jgi:DNA-binding IclR family transcriptional regulator
VASWQLEVVALATPIVAEGHPVYVLNMSVSTQMTPDMVGKELSAQLMELAARIRQAVVAL